MHLAAVGLISLVSSASVQKGEKGGGAAGVAQQFPFPGFECSNGLLVCFELGSTHDFK